MTSSFIVSNYKDTFEGFVVLLFFHHSCTTIRIFGKEPCFLYYAPFVPDTAYAGE